mgnify:FL=1|tara:strand:- start:13 stop:1038 length:1026 start_codon:yes stop_codon:yes gene_type:complete
MKVALCLSGQPRLYEECYEWIKTFIIDEYGGDNVDVFCHFWWDGEKGYPALSPWNFDRHDSDSFKEHKRDINEDLIRLYKPKDIAYSTQTNLIKYHYDNDRDELKKEKDNVYKIFKRKNRSFWRDYPERLQNYMRDNLKQIFESQWECQQLKLNYEKKHNFKYDLVIRTRYDLTFNPHYDNDILSPPERGNTWGGKFGTLPNIAEIKTLFSGFGYKDGQEFCPPILTEWDNLWFYSSKVHDVLMRQMFENFDDLFEQIVGLKPMIDAHGTKYTYKFIDILAIPEQLQETACRSISNYDGFSLLEGCGLNALLWIPRDGNDLKVCKERWKEAIKNGHKGEIW